MKQEPTTTWKTLTLKTIRLNKKVLKWNFIFQYGWVLTNIFNSLLLLPLYLRNIDTATLGVWLATGNLLGWMLLADPGIGDVLQQRIAEVRGQGQHGEAGKLIGSGFIASGIILVCSLLVGVAGYFFIGHIINKDISQYPHLAMALLISIVATGMTLVSFSVSGINQGLHNSAHVAISSLTANFLFLLVNLVLLFAGWGVMSIAIANLCRAVYINCFNILSMSGMLKKQGLRIGYEWQHFKKFIRIFSVTSVSKIITGISYSIDMIVLARYISPSMITVYEINKRPINIAYSLIGRHSVALMPVISHAKGSGDKDSIHKLVSIQFRFYCYAALFSSFIFLFNYKDLVSAWIGEQQYAGQLIISLLVSSFFVSLLSYFIAIVGYALGDIRMNSIYNIIRNLCYGVLMFFAAKYFGIIGTVIVAISMALCADLLFYSWRLRKLGYLEPKGWGKFFVSWLVIIPLSFLVQWCISMLINNLVSANSHLLRVFINGTLFTGYFLLLVLLSDGIMRRLALGMFNKLTSRFSFKKVTA